MEFNVGNKENFIICENCEKLNCSNPCRILKFKNNNCKKYEDYTENQIEFIKNHIVNQGENFEIFIRKEINHFERYFNLKKGIENENNFIRITNEEEKVIGDNDITVIMLNNFVLRKCLKEIFSFERMINKNEYFVVLTKSILSHLNAMNRDALNSGNINLRKEIEEQGCRKSWDNKLMKRRNPVLMSNISLDILSVCSDIINIINDPTEIFDDIYLKSMNFIREIKKYQKRVENNDDEDIQGSISHAENMKICKIVKLDYRNAHIHKTITYCKHLEKTGVSINFYYILLLLISLNKY